MVSNCAVETLLDLSSKRTQFRRFGYAILAAYTEVCGDCGKMILGHRVAMTPCSYFVLS